MNTFRFLILFAVLFMVSQVQAQRIKVSGEVSDSEGNPLPFVNVLVKSSTTGTMTEIDGSYQISVEGNAILLFSSLGYVSKEVAVQDRETIDVVLLDDTEALDEVVISTGYNSIASEHLTSSVGVMDMEKLNSRPIGKLQEGFAGTIPGITVRQRNNLPGDAPALSIRGVSTLGSASALVIVDGMEQSMTDIDPNQVTSISVLKDAAAASLYGSRGANGVIIIKTKRGQSGKFNVDVHSWISVDDPIDLPDFVNSADYMRLNNEARNAQGQTPLFNQQQIDRSQNGQLPNTDWMGLVRQRTADAFNTSVNMSGGGGVGTFNLMLGYLTENGLNMGEGTEKFSARFNTDINISDDFVLLADFYAHRLQVDRLNMNSDGNGLYKRAWMMNPTQEPYYISDLPDHYRYYDGNNPLPRIEKGGFRNNLHDRSTINLRPTYSITDELDISANLSYKIDKSANKYKRATFKFYDGDGKPVETWKNDVGASQGVSQSQVTARVLANYKTRLRGGKDNLNFLVGAETMNYLYSDYREVNKVSFFSSVNYAFNERYLFGATVRRDGSSKFAPGHRWGVFPSASIGWNVHNEDFMASLKNDGIINRLKFRASYGKIGNENVAPYQWEEVVNNWGWTMRVPNPSFSWEKQKQLDIGVDITALDKRLQLTFDIYDKQSYDLIYEHFPVPPLTGSYDLETAANIGEVENKGWELSAQWSDKIGELRYSVKGMMFNNKNKVMKAGYASSDTLNFKGNSDKIWYKGIPIDNFYGFKTDGYFQNQTEIDGTQAKLPNTLPGDIKYVDQNGDGVINDDDRVFLGDPFPHYNYSIMITLNYKNWDFMAFGEGVGKKLGRLNGLEGYPVIMDGKGNNLGTPRQYYMDNRWTPETPRSRFPRVWTGSTTNDELSDVWLSDMSYFRIKSLQLGYTIPKIGNAFKDMRIYLNAQDAFTFTSWEGLDPERQGGSGDYPRMATYSLGAKFTIF